MSQIWDTLSWAVFFLYFPCIIGGGNDMCWSMGFDFDLCCEPIGLGNPVCFDDFFTYKTCCEKELPIWSVQDCYTSHRQVGFAYIQEVAKYFREGTITPRFVSGGRMVGDDWFCADAMRLWTLVTMEGNFYLGDEDWFKMHYLLDHFTQYRHPMSFLSVVGGEEFSENKQYTKNIINFDDHKGPVFQPRMLSSISPVDPQGAREKFGDSLRRNDSEIELLVQGMLHRAHSLRYALVTAPSDITVGLVIPVCKGSDVEQLKQWLFPAIWRDFVRLDRFKANLKFYVVAKCASSEEGAAAAKEAGQLMSDTGITTVVRRVDDFGSIRSDECSGYVGLLLEEYDDPPEWTFFLHPDAPEHTQSSNWVLDLMYVACSGGFESAFPDFEFSYLSLNYLDPFWAGKKGNPYNTAYRRLYAEVFNLQSWRMAPDPAVPKEVSVYCCSQFLVSRKAWQYRPKVFFRRLLEKLQSPSLFESVSFFPGRSPENLPPSWLSRTQAGGCDTCQLFQPFWHVIFGETPYIPERALNPKLPLLLKLKNLDPSWLKNLFERKIAER